MKKESVEQKNFERALEIFLIEISGLSDALPILIKSLLKAHDDKINEIKEFLESKGTLSNEDDSTKNEEAEVYRLTPEYIYEMRQLTYSRKHLTAATMITPKGFVMTAVSQFDAFLGRLIKAMYYIKPEMLNDSEKKLTFENLVNFSSIDAAREFIVEKEVESVLRESHTKHFEWLEKKLKTPLRKIDIWPDFIELTERRNLFVHTGGEVSSQYIQVCSENNVVFDKEVSVGDVLWASPEYFQKSCNILFELATKLTYVVWRKLKPNDAEKADQYINGICYRLLKEEKYDLAQRILEFALSQPKQSSQSMHMTFIVNVSIAYKWGGRPQKAQEIISTTDWSACNDTFQLVSKVLLDQYEEAASIMRKIGPDHEFRKAYYRDWPVFKDFRHSLEFEQAYKELYGGISEAVEVGEGSNEDNFALPSLDVTEELPEPN